MVFVVSIYIDAHNNSLQLLHYTSRLTYQPTNLFESAASQLNLSQFERFSKRCRLPLPTMVYLRNRIKKLDQCPESDNNFRRRFTLMLQPAEMKWHDQHQSYYEYDFQPAKPTSDDPVMRLIRKTLWDLKKINFSIFAANITVMSPTVAPPIWLPDSGAPGHEIRF
jgi:hypothetical protein